MRSPQPPLSEGRAFLRVAAPAEWTIRTLFMTILTMLGVGLVFFLLYRFYMVVFLLFVAIALQIAIDPFVQWLYRHRIRRELGVFLVYLVLLALLAALFWIAAPVLIEQTRTAVNELPAYYQNARTYLAESPISLLRGIVALLPAQPSLSFLMALSGGETSADTEQSRSWVEVSGRTLFAFFAVFALAYYWTLEGSLILRKLALQVPEARRDEVRALIAEIQAKIGSYFRGQLILCVIVGVLSTVAFALLGVPNSLLLGLLMGIFEAIPLLGPALGAIPAVLMTLAAVPDKILWVIGTLVVIQVAENNLLVPRVMGPSVGVNAVVTLLAIAAFGVLFGITGAILAIPLAAILQIFLNRILFDTPIGDDAPTAAGHTNDMVRSRLGVLRLEAQELAQAVRTQARTAELNHESNNVTKQTKDEIEDEIEALAADLDSVLARMEDVA
jgi:predicted PurR-regulated permease PerM